MNEPTLGRNGAATDDRSTGPVPELDVFDLDASLAFYLWIIGFTLVYERPAERFAYLDIEGANVMLREAAGPGRRFRTAPLERPYGRGINFETGVSDVDALYQRVLAAGIVPVAPIEERWYDIPADPGQRTSPGPISVGNRQFVVGDPDGYLWRFVTSIGPDAQFDLGPTP